MRKTAGNRVHTCRVCGGTFHRWTDEAVYCSRTCMAIDYRARNAAGGNPAWRGGQWKYKGRGWPEISAAIVGRDGACLDCGGADDLIAHHLIPQRFWLDLDAANEPGNLTTLCTSCHARRPEHYWVALPAELYVEGLHAAEPPERTRARLRDRPACQLCGERCKTHRARFCSYACSNRARWAAGTYDRATIVRNLGPDPALARRHRA